MGPQTPHTLLLVHGFTDSASTWTPLRPHLEPAFELLTPTLVGHHGGPGIPPGMSDPMATMADELERTLDRAGLERVLVVGNSLGGWLAFVLAGRGRATGVLALSPAFGWPEEQPPARTRRQFARAQRMAPVGARFARMVTARAPTRRLAFWELIAHPARVPPSTAAKLIRGAADCPMYRPYTDFTERQDYRAEWRPVGVPAVIAWGDRDRTTPRARSSAWYRDALPDARWVTLPGCGHLPQHDDPELVAALVHEVAAGLEPDARPSVGTRDGPTVPPERAGTRGGPTVPPERAGTRATPTVPPERAGTRATPTVPPERARN